MDREVVVVALVVQSFGFVILLGYYLSPLRFDQETSVSITKLQNAKMGFTTAVVGGSLGFAAQCMSNSIQKIPLSRRKFLFVLHTTPFRLDRSTN